MAGTGLSCPFWAGCPSSNTPAHNAGASDWDRSKLDCMLVQDGKVNPKAQDHVTFRTCLNPTAIKAAEKVGGVAAQYAGRSVKPHSVANTHM